MVDCELTFKAGKFKIEKCLEKSLLRGDIKSPFKSTDRNEIKQFMKNVLTDNIKYERNINNLEELSYFYNIIFHIIHLDTIENPIELYCEVTLR